MAVEDVLRAGCCDGRGVSRLRGRSGLDIWPSEADPIFLARFRDWSKYCFELVLKVEKSAAFLSKCKVARGLTSRLDAPHSKNVVIPYRTVFNFRYSFSQRNL